MVGRCFPQAAVAALSSLFFFSFFLFLRVVILSCALRKNPTVIVSFPRAVWFCEMLRIQGVMVCCDILFSVCSLEWSGC